MTKPTIQAIDNFLPEEAAEYVSKFCESAHYRYGEYDDMNEQDPADPTGLVHDVFTIEKPGFDSKDDENLYNLFVEYIEKKYPNYWDTYGIYRMYVNCFAPREYAYFHQDCCEDSDQYTFLYYPRHSMWEYDVAEGGWTEFYMENDKKIIGVPPYFNSMSMFTARLVHRATPFKSHHRFTVAIKTVLKEEAPEFFRD